MKTKLHILQTALFIVASFAHAQGVFIYDQQSATNQGTADGDNGAAIQENQPIGQSFTPSLSGVWFVQFKFTDIHLNGLGASVYVNLWSGSISTGTLLGSTTAVFMRDGIDSGITNFVFSTPVSVTPGQTYYLQPVVQSGDDPWFIIGNAYNYSGGELISQGIARSDVDLWFREGIINVPEPSFRCFFLLGVTGLTFWRRITGNNQPTEKELNENQIECFSHRLSHYNIRSCPRPKSAAG